MEPKSNFSGASTESAMHGQTDTQIAAGEKRADEVALHPAVPNSHAAQTGVGDPSIPVTPGNQHLVIGSDPKAAEEARLFNATGAGNKRRVERRVESIGRPDGAVNRRGSGDRRASGLSSTEAAVAEQEAKTPEFAPGLPPPRTDADAEPSDPSTPGFQGLKPLEERLADAKSDQARHEELDGIPTGTGDPSTDPGIPTGTGEPQAAVQQGHLPEGFPGKDALEAAGEATYAKVRKRIEAGTLTEIPGIGDATAERIEEAIAE